MAWAAASAASSGMEDVGGVSVCMCARLFLFVVKAFGSKRDRRVADPVVFIHTQQLKRFGVGKQRQAFVISHAFHARHQRRTTHRFNLLIGQGTNAWLKTRETHANWCRQ